MRVLGAKKSFGRVVTQFFRYNSTESVKQLEDAVKQKSTTVDRAEVEYHTRLCDRWWVLDGELRALHEMNPLRIKFVRDGLANVGWKEKNPSRPLEGLKILDAGCGGGIFSEPLARIGATVTGLDASEGQITVARQHASFDPDLSGRLTYVHSTIEELADRQPRTYDAVVSSEVLEHVSDQQLFLKSCVDILKPGGSIFLTTVNKTLTSWLGGIVLAEYILKALPKGTHDWNKFISPDETGRILESCGCRTKLIHGLIYNPLKYEWFWSSSVAINYALHAIKKK